MVPLVVAGGVIVAVIARRSSCRSVLIIVILTILGGTQIVNVTSNASRVIAFGMAAKRTSENSTASTSSDSAEIVGYNPYEFPPFAVTCDLMILTVRPPELQVLLVKREQPPHAGQWALPGGFVGPDQSLVEAAQFKLADKTGIALQEAHLEQLASFGDPHRDPRMRVISVAWLAMVAHPDEPVAGTESSDAAWINIADLGPGDLAFDHAAILDAGLERARNRIEYTTLAPTFCAAEFTMGELRSIYETLWGHQLDPANFNRKVLASTGFVEPTGHVVAQAKGRPAKTYRRGPAQRLAPPLQR